MADEFVAGPKAAELHGGASGGVYQHNDSLRTLMGQTFQKPEDRGRLQDIYMRRRPPLPCGAWYPSRRYDDVINHKTFEPAGFQSEARGNIRLSAERLVKLTGKSFCKQRCILCRRLGVGTFNLHMNMVPGAGFANRRQVKADSQEPELLSVDASKGAGSGPKLMNAKGKQAAPLAEPGHLTQARLFQNSNGVGDERDKHECQGPQGKHGGQEGAALKRLVPTRLSIVHRTRVGSTGNAIAKGRSPSRDVFWFALFQRG